MKIVITHLTLAAAFVSLAVLSPPTSALAQESRNVPADRLERLERRVNEMAERQEQILRRLGDRMERPGPMAPPGGENLHQPMPPNGMPIPGPHNPPGAKLAKGLLDTLGLLFLIGIICNILLAIWIYTDIRKRGEGSGIFIAMALVAGIPAALIYALTRIGDKKP